MSKFVTREFVIPPSPSPPSSPTFPGGVRRKSENAKSDPPPALPDSLMEALAREPPPPPHGRSPHLRHTRTPSFDHFPSPPSPSSTSFLLPSSPSTRALHSSLLPDLPPLSPLGIPYPSLSRSPSMNDSIRSSPSTSPVLSKGKGRSSNFLSDRLNRATTLSPTSDTSPLLSDGSGLGFYSAGEDPASLDTDDSPPRVPKKSLWKAVAFGRQKARSPSPSTIFPSVLPLPPPHPDHVVAQSIPIANIEALQPSPISAMVSTKRSDVTLRKKASNNALGVAEEGERLASQVEQAVARRASGGAGRGIDQDLDDMDREERTRRSSKHLLGVDESVAVPWRGGERYIHDLVAVEDGDDNSEGEETATLPNPAIDPAETLYSRRRQLGAEGLALLTISPTMLPLASPLIPPKSAPLLPHPTFRSNPPHLKAETMEGRSWSDGRLDVTAAGDLPDDEKLAASLGLKPSGSVAVVIESPIASRPSTSDFVVAVVGPRNVGKSTVIRRGLKRPVEKPSIILEDEKGHRATTCASQFHIGGQSRSVEVLEIDMALLKYDSAGVVWPPELPKCEGAMLCYDATDSRALESLSLLLQAFWTRGSEMPLIVLACKASLDDSLNSTDTKKAAEICNVYGAGIVSLDGGVTDEGKKMKNSWNWMIREIMNIRGEPRRPSVASTPSPNQSRRASVWPEPQSRQPSIAPIAGQPLDVAIEARATLHDIPVTFANPFDTSTLPLEPSVFAPPDRKESVAPLDCTTLNQSEADSLTRTPSMAAQSAPLDLHFSREDMIDKFLFASVTKNDELYVNLFLIVYRRFARPHDVLTKLIERFDFVAGRLKTDPLLSRFAQMKLCGVLSTWFQAYPGDFTGRATFESLQSFLESLLPRGATWVAHYAIELIPLLKSVSRMDDPDTSWALPDESLIPPPPETVVEGERRRPSLVPSFESSGGAPTPRLGGTEAFNPAFDSSSFPPLRRRESDTKTSGTGDSTERRREGKDGKATQMGLLLEYSNTLLLEGSSEDMIATQITRLAWDAFSEITPRNLMRHVLSPGHLRDPKSNVVRSIDFVNYLADWVASMLLVQSRIKQRSRLLEKFIAIAYALREQENFDSLMGVLAGLNAQPIFRLSETMEIVSLKLERDKTKMPKRLRSLNKLMAVSKSFAAYRIALANSGAHTLPYLGVHLQDITIINEVKSDMRLGLVNWSKFQQMGRSAAIVLDCARLAPQLPVDRLIERCIHNVPLLDKDAQYALSYNYQPRRNANGSGTTAFRKLLNTALA